jgi:hypothetical protein
MSPRQQEWFLKWWPILLMMGSGLVGWTTIQRDVQELKADKVEAPRFEAESIRVHNELAALREMRNALRRVEADVDLIPRICAAVKCNK